MFPRVGTPVPDVQSHVTRPRLAGQALATLGETEAARMTVVVVGGGVLGLMHAVEARRPRSRRGSPGAGTRPPGGQRAQLRTDLAERPRGGPELDLARRARARWERLAGEVPGIGFRPHGSLTLATDDAELTLLKEAAARPDARLRGYELLDPAGVRRVNPALRGEFAGGLHGQLDAIVEPRQVPTALRGYLQAGQPGRGRVHLAARAGGGAGHPARGPRPHRCLAPRRPGRALPRGGAHRGGRARIWRAGHGRRCAGSGCRCCRPARSART